MRCVCLTIFLTLLNSACTAAPKNTGLVSPVVNHVDLRAAEWSVPCKVKDDGHGLKQTLRFFEKDGRLFHTLTTDWYLDSACSRHYSHNVLTRRITKIGRENDQWKMDAELVSDTWMLTDADTVELFNQNKQCGRDTWALNEVRESPKECRSSEANTTVSLFVPLLDLTMTWKEGEKTVWTRSESGLGRGPASLTEPSFRLCTGDTFALLGQVINAPVPREISFEVNPKAFAGIRRENAEMRRIRLERIRRAKEFFGQLKSYCSNKDIP